MFTITIEDQNGQVAKPFAFDHGEYIIGRTDECDIVLPSSSVSRRHARIFIENGRCYIEDLGSANGVIVDGQRLLRRRDLGTASQVRVGDFYLYLEFQQQQRLQNQDVRSTLFIDTGDEHFKLVRINDDYAGEEFSLSEQDNTIGRTDDNFILLSDSSISRNHAVIQRFGDLYSIRDLNSSNGTELNGNPVASENQELTSGDRIRFGSVEFLFLPGNQSPQDALAAAVNSRTSSVSPLTGYLVLMLAGLAIGGLLVFVVINMNRDDGPPLAEASLDPLQERVKSLLESGEEQLRVGNWEAASAAFDEALAVEPQNANAQALRQRVAREREGAEILTRVENLSEEGRHSEARDLVNEIPDDTFAFERARPTIAHLDRTVAYNLRSEASRLLRRSDDNLAEVHERLIQALEIEPDNDETRDLLKTTEEQMRQKGLAFQPYSP